MLCEIFFRKWAETYSYWVDLGLIRVHWDSPCRKNQKWQKLLHYAVSLSHAGSHELPLMSNTVVIRWFHGLPLMCWFPWFTTDALAFNCRYPEHSSLFWLLRCAVKAFGATLMKSICTAYFTTRHNHRFLRVCSAYDHQNVKCFANQWVTWWVLMWPNDQIPTIVLYHY